MGSTIHLTANTHQNANTLINDLMKGFTLSWGTIK